MGLLDRITLTAHSAPPPESIDLTEQGELRIAWPGGFTATIPYRVMRDLCPCAGCVEEGTGKKLLDPASIPADIHPARIEPVGNYAVKISWSDGHDTGFYSWQTLREVCDRATQGAAR